MSDSRTIVLELLADIRPEADYENSQDFLEDGLLDSFGLIGLVAGMEEKFGINIDGTEILPEYFLNLKSIQTLLTKYGVKE